MKTKRKIEKEYKENDVKITRYSQINPKKVVIKGKPRKPVYGWKPPK